MNEVAPYDWRTFFTTRLNSTSSGAPLDGIKNGGWRLVYTDSQGDYQKAIESSRKVADLSYSIGVSVKDDGTVVDVVPGSPAAVAGLGPGMKILSVNGRSYETDRLRDALRYGKTSTEPLEMMVENGDFSKSYKLKYHDGERYPHLQRDPDRSDLLEQIIKPLLPRGK
jgi:predicted metalloprotease with PDZ domain